MKRTKKKLVKALTLKKESRKKPVEVLDSDSKKTDQYIFGGIKKLYMPGSLVFTATILMQKFPGSVKLTYPDNQCHIMRRLENLNYEELPATGYICNLYHYIGGSVQRSTVL